LPGVEAPHVGGPPRPDDLHEDLILPVDYKGIVQCGKTATNYQLLPGDRLYVKAAPLITLDAYIARVVAPIERVVGTNLLINSLIGSYQGIVHFGTTGSGVVTGTGTGVGIITPVGR